MRFSRKNPPPGYYHYLYLRENGTPYYSGKGKGVRAWSTDHAVHPPRDPSLIVITHWGLTELWALAMERWYIRWYGRKDLGTGILRNMTDGGEGTSGWVPADSTKGNISKALLKLGDDHQSKRPEHRERARLRWAGDKNHMKQSKHRDRARQILLENNPSQTPEFSASQREYQLSLGENHPFRSSEYRESRRLKMTGDGNVAKRPEVRAKLKENNAMNNPDSVEKVRQKALSREKIECPHCGKMCAPHGIGSHIKSCIRKNNDEINK